MGRKNEPNKAAKPYTVGYGKPPEHTRFQKNQSGNPAGKKKGHKSVRAVVAAVFQEKVSIRTARGIRKVTKLDALVHKIMNDALTGDQRAVGQVVRLAKEAGLTQEAAVLEAAATPDLADEDRAILDRYMKPERRS